MTSDVEILYHDDSTSCILLLDWVDGREGDNWMKTRSERNTVKISVASYEKMRDEIATSALRDGVKQGIALALYTMMASYGWRRKRLHGLLDAIDDTLHMPDILGVTPTAESAIELLRERYHVDIDKIPDDAIRVKLEG